MADGEGPPSRGRPVGSFLVFPRKVATPAMLASALPSKNSDPGSGTVVGALDARRSPDSELVITFAGKQVPFGQKNC